METFHDSRLARAEARVALLERMQQLASARSRIQGCVAETFFTRTSLLEACRKLAHIMCSEFEWDYMAIWTPAPASWKLRCVDAWTRPSLDLSELENEVQSHMLAQGVDLAGRVWSARRAEWLVTEPGGGAQLPSGLKNAAFRSGLAFPVKYEDDVLAVIEVCSRAPQQADTSLVALLEVAGVQLASAELRERAERRANAAQAEADDAREQLEAVLSCVPALVMAVDRDGKLRFVNRAQSDSTGGEASGTSWQGYVPAVARERTERALAAVLAGAAPEQFDICVTRPQGGTTWYTQYLAPIRSGTHVSGALLVSQDITQVKQAQQELFGAQRLAALGTMAAGIAHEINTPVQFVGDSLDFLRDASHDTEQLIISLLRLRMAVEEQAEPKLIAGLIERTKQAEEQADLEYLQQNVGKAFDRCADGLTRVTTIVRSMKEFSHPSHKEMMPVDLNRAIMATLTVARNEYKYVADVVTQFAELPQVKCHVNEINQVVLNIIVNAAHAIADKNAGSMQRGTITVSTALRGELAEIAITDTGGGIPEEVRDRIFDPFFTTKEVGRGTGQGLALAWRAVKERHGGELSFDTQLGVGTTFFVRLPVGGQRPSRELT